MMDLAPRRLLGNMMLGGREGVIAKVKPEFETFCFDLIRQSAAIKADSCFIATSWLKTYKRNKY